VDRRPAASLPSAAASVGAFALGLLALVVGGCTSAHVIDTWRSPQLTGPVHLSRILAIAVHPDGAVRRIAEDEMVRQIGAARATPAYQVIGDAYRADSAAFKNQIRKAGFDGVITLTVTAVRDQTRFVSAMGDSYEPFYVYYDRSTTASETPDYFVTDTIARVETRIYSVADERVLWAAVSDAFDPADTRKTVRDVLQAVGAELRKQKLIE
jgi:hypothetical protein